MRTGKVTCYMRTTKHIALIVALGAAFALMLAGAVPAFATYGNTTYLDWDVVKLLPGNAGATSPHGGYVVGTSKCGVCHSVHGAAAAGEALLQDDKANACSFCHISPGVSTLIVYGGSTNNYSLTDTNTAHNTTSLALGQDGVTCGDCHQVHAASEQMTANGLLSDKILSGPKTDYNGLGDPLYDPRAGAPLGTDGYEDALSKWCTKCHFNAAYGYYSTSYNDETHVMRAPSGGYLAANGTNLGDIAYQSSAQCGDCHSRGYLTGTWPHYTPGAARFLESAGNASLAATAAATSEQDGVCLRCHKDGVGNGVGGHY